MPVISVWAPAARCGIVSKNEGEVLTLTKTGWESMHFGLVGEAQSIAVDPSGNALVVMESGAMFSRVGEPRERVEKVHSRYAAPWRPISALPSHTGSPLDPA